MPWRLTCSRPPGLVSWPAARPSAPSPPPSWSAWDSSAGDRPNNKTITSLYYIKGAMTVTSLYNTACKWYQKPRYISQKHFTWHYTQCSEKSILLNQNLFAGLFTPQFSSSTTFIRIFVVLTAWFEVSPLRLWQYCAIRWCSSSLSKYSKKL